MKLKTTTYLKLVFTLAIFLASCSDKHEESKSGITLENTTWKGVIENKNAKENLRIWFTGKSSVNIWFQDDEDFITFDYYISNDNGYITFNSLDYDKNQLTELMNTMWKISFYDNSNLKLEIANPSKKAQIILTPNKNNNQ